MKPVQVSQLNRYIKTVLQNDPLLSNISVVGEVSNLKYHGTGHVYFSLKDKNGRINCFLPSDKVKYLRYPLEEGMEIIASGYIYLYEKGGSYSLNVKEITIEGEGNLAVAFEKLKKKLDSEGLFSQEFKKPLPFFPKSIGIATSNTGAAVWDMIRTIRNKNEYVKIIICPCLVQGDGAAGDIEDAINSLNLMDNPPDVIIVGRGGGSSEELWAFNEERVARSIFNSKIPVISAVGHETDFTISDFVADYRAATPTAAAEKAVPDIRLLKDEMKLLLMSISNEMKNKINYLDNSVEMYSKKYFFEKLENMISLYSAKIDGIMKDSLIILKEKFHKEELRIEQMKSRIDSMNPKTIMQLGYGAVSDSAGNLIKNVSNVNVGDIIDIDMSDGRIRCSVLNKNINDDGIFSPEKQN